MNLLKLIGDIFTPAANLIDEMHTSDDEKLTAKNKLMAIQAGTVSQVIEFETAQLNAKRDIIVAEAKSDSWLARNWRPMTMLAFVVGIMAFWFGLVPDNPKLTETVILSMYGLVKIGVGGYITSRGIEKVAPKVVEALKKREEV